MKRSIAIRVSVLTVSAIALYGCGGGGSSSGGGSGPTTELTGKSAVKATVLSGYQTFQGGLSYPLLQYGATLPSSSPLKATVTSGLQGMFGYSSKPLSLRTLPHTSLNYSSTFGLYDGGITISGSTETDTFYLDAAGTKPAGHLTLSYPAGTVISGVGTVSIKPPYTVTITADMTAGALPIDGTGSIAVQDAAGACEIQGRFDFPKTGVNIKADLTIDDAGNATGSTTITENGQTITSTDLSGPLSSNIVGTVNVSPQGYTGDISISPLDASFMLTLNTPQGTSTGVFTSGTIVITYPGGGGQETVNDPLGTSPASPPTTTTTPGTYGTPVNIGANLYPFHLTDNGQIVGTDYSGAGKYWSGPKSASVSLPLYQGNAESPEAINDGGEIVGFGFNTYPNIVWSSPTATPAVLPGNGVPQAINDSGQIAGFGSGFGLFWSSASVQPTDLAPLTGDTTSSAGAISPSGEVAGVSYGSSSNIYHAVYWSGAAVHALPGTENYSFTTFGINSSGQVFACDAYGTPPTSVYWSSLTANPVVLPPLVKGSASTATGASSMNSTGVIVGSSLNASGGTSAVIWKNGKVTDLNTLITSGSGWVLDSAASINDNGDIVGTGTYQGNTYAYYISPAN